MTTSHDTRDPADTLPRVTLRVPGYWDGPEEFQRALPEDHQLADDQLVLPDGTRADLSVYPADDEFVPLFAGACTRPPTELEQEKIEGYRVNLLLTLTGGSLDAAQRILTAGAVAIRAGGWGVLVDNSGIAHGRTDWLALADGDNADGGGTFWAFLAVYGNDQILYTRGMHVMGYRDAVLPRTGEDELDDFMLRNFLAYSYRSPKPLEDGDVLGGISEDTGEPKALHRIYKQPDDFAPPGSPMHNPYGLWWLDTADDPDDLSRGTRPPD